MRKYKKPIGTYCRLYHTQVQMEVADLEAEMYLVLYKCVQSYNPDAGASFNTFIWQGIYNRFRAILRANGRIKRQIVEIPFDHTHTSDPNDEDANHFSAWVSTLALTPGAEVIYEAEQNVMARMTSRQRELINA